MPVAYQYNPGGYLDIPTLRQGIYLDGVNKVMMDVGGNNTTLGTDGHIMLINNQAQIYGRGQIEWIRYDSNTATGSAITTYMDSGYVVVPAATPTATTIRVRYNALDGGTGNGLAGQDWGPLGYFVPQQDTAVTDWEWNTDGTAAMTIKVYRDWDSNWFQYPVQSPAEKIREVIAARCGPNIIRDRRMLDHSPDLREIRARQTLRRVIGDDKFRNFICKGFVTVRGKSGKTYQIFPGHGITNVYFRGKMLEKLCVVLSGISRRQTASL